MQWDVACPAQDKIASHGREDGRLRRLIWLASPPAPESRSSVGSRVSLLVVPSRRLSVHWGEDRRLISRKRGGRGRKKRNGDRRRVERKTEITEREDRGMLTQSEIQWFLERDQTERDCFSLASAALPTPPSAGRPCTAVCSARLQFHAAQTYRPRLSATQSSLQRPASKGETLPLPGAEQIHFPYATCTIFISGRPTC